MSRAVLLYGDEALLNEYNKRVNEKLNAQSGSCIIAVGINRGIQQMFLDIQTYDPFGCDMGINNPVGAYFNAKNQFYRLISLLLSDLGMIFDIRCPSPWQIISELLKREIISEPESLDMKECLSFANEIRLRTYFANNGQREHISPIPQHANTTQQCSHGAVLQNVNQDILVRFLNTSHDIYRRCKHFCTTFSSQGKIGHSIFLRARTSFSNAMLLGFYYYRLQNFPEALKWVKSESKDSPYYAHCVAFQGHIYWEYGEYDNSINCFEEAVKMGYLDDPNADVLKMYNGLASSLFYVGKYELSIAKIKEAICKHNEIYGEKNPTFMLIILMGTLACHTYRSVGNFSLAVKRFKEAQAIQEKLTNVPDMVVAFLNINMAFTLCEREEYELQSIECIEKGLELGHKVLGEHNRSIIMAEIYGYAGRVYSRCNRINEAVSCFERSLDLYQRIVGDNPDPGKVEVLMDFGLLFFQRMHKPEKALENLECALKLARAVNNKKLHITLAKILSNTGVILASSGKLDQSIPYFVEAKEIMDELLEPNHAHPLTLSILINMALSQRNVGNFPEALRFFNDAFNMNRKLLEEYGNCGEIEAICFQIAGILTTLTRFDEAKIYCKEAIKIVKTIPLTNKKCSNAMKIVHLLAWTCSMFGQENEAFKYLEEARKIVKDTGYKDWMVVWVLVVLIKEYARIASFDESLMCYLEAREIAKSLTKDPSLPDFILEMLKLMKL